MRKFPTRIFRTKLFLVIVMITTSFFFPAAIALTQADQSILPPDSDLDGLSDIVEMSGWVNERVNDQGGGVPYHTDPYDADSDDDGITDGEEMLFNSNPNDNTSPGLYTVYEDRFETGEYVFAWTPVKRSGIFRPQGNKMIGTETIVIRRGTTFTVGGPSAVNGYPVSLAWSDGLKNPGVLTPLSISSRNPCGAACNRWTVSVPSGGTVGKYKLTATNGQGWTDTLIVDVIFEMPSGLTDSQVDAFLYDGDRNNKRDETGIWFYGSGTDPYQDLKIRLYADTYDLSQYSSYIFDGDEAVKRYYSGPASKYPSTIKAIHGKTNTWDASASLTKLADDFTCFAYPLTPRVSAWNTLFPGGSNINNQCSNIAGLLTSFHRSVGIPARMFATDHRNSNFDTSTEIWTRSGSSGSYTWYASRSFRATEGDPNNLGYCSATRVSGGYYPRVTRSEWGRTIYKPYSRVWPSRGSAANGNEWMIVTANENWIASETTGWPPDYEWVVWDKYNVARNSWFETHAMDYWNAYYRVNQEPTNVGDPDEVNPPAWNESVPPDWLPTTPPGSTSLNPISNPEGDGNYTVSWTNASEAQYYRLEEDNNSGFSSPTVRYYGGGKTKNISGQSNGTWYYRVRAENAAGNSSWSNTRSVTVSSSGAPVSQAERDAPENQPSLDTASSTNLDKVYLGQAVGDHGFDEDGDGKFDALIIEVKVLVNEPGSYWVQGQLGTEDPAFLGTGGVMAIDEFQVDLQAGEQIVNLVFDGLSISRTRINGPYKLMHLLITDIANPTPDDFVNNTLDAKNDSYVTGAYNFNNFKTLDAMFARNYTERKVDNNKDSYLEALEIDVALDIYKPGTYKVSGELYDGNDVLRGEATWTGSGSVATLRFDAIAGAAGPYDLRNLLLTTADGTGLDELERGYKTKLTTPGQLVSGFTYKPQYNSSPMKTIGVGITSTAYVDAGIDLNSNGKFDLVRIQVGIQAVTADNYQLEGWLVDEQGNLVSWAHAGPVNLGVGFHQLALDYDGRALADYMRFRGVTAQKFTLTALKLYTGPLKWDEIDDEVDIAYTTGTYNIAQFEPAAHNVVLEDLMEQGPAAWTNVETPWEIVDIGTFHSGSHAWRASEANASLATVVDLTNITNPVLKFRTYHRLNDSTDIGYVEVSRNGTNWQTIATRTEHILSWETKVLDLSTFASLPGIHIRFRLAAAGGMSNDFWYIEDVTVAGNIFDSDHDGLPDAQEVQIGTNPYNPDTDGDGLPDGWEVSFGLNPTNPTGNNGAGGDLDGDGLSNGDEFAHNTNPTNPDTDGDGLPDGWEVSFGLDPIDPTGPNGASGDLDGDGLSNGDEFAHNTNPTNPDTDNDGLPDGWEVFYGLNPTSSAGNDGPFGDPDFDGLNNAAELANGTDPTNPDTDGDGLPDGWEVRFDLDPTDSTGDNGGSGDPDEDGLTNEEELEIGTDPQDPDTDDDGILDGEDDDPGSVINELFMPIIKK